jgi:hypothetical protein
MIPTAIGRLVARAVESLRDPPLPTLHPYRPELHYMRGKGPKWLAKHGPNGR